MKKAPRHPTKKAEFIASAWDKEAGDSKFSSLTPAQYRSQIKVVSDLEEEITGLEQGLAAKRGELKAGRKDLNKTSGRVVSAVRGDPEHGSDSPLLAVIGYVTDSERRSGKTNKTNGNGNGNGQPHA